MFMPSASIARSAPVLPPARGATGTAPADSFSTLINLVGRQRMLSQRIVLFCVLGAQGDTSALATAQEALDLFRGTHARLLQGRLALEGDAPQALQAAFFGPEGVDAPVREFVRLAEETLNAVANLMPAVKRLLPSLVARATPMLHRLDALTLVYEAQAERAADEQRVNRC